MENEELNAENQRLTVENMSLKRAAAAGVDGCRSNLEIVYDELEMNTKVGGGGFSVVYRASWFGTPVGAPGRPPRSS